MSPWLMKALAIVGTVAMFMVGGGIVVHGIAPLHHFVENLVVESGGGLLGGLVSTLFGALTGVLVGALCTFGVMAVGRLVKAVRA